MRRLIRLLAFLCAALIAALIMVTVMHRAPRSVVVEWKQPDGMVYHALGPYYLSVLKDDLDWSGFPVNVSRNYSIYVGRESGKPTHGHVVKYSFHPGPESHGDEEEHIKRSTVEWAEDGVSFKEASGHRLFIPKAMFVGGRWGRVTAALHWFVVRASARAFRDSLNALKRAQRTHDLANAS